MLDCHDFLHPDRPHKSRIGNNVNEDVQVWLMYYRTNYTTDLQ